jgi:hypothetical protein
VVTPDLTASRALAGFNYQLHFRQRIAFESWAQEILFGGAKGGGKSFLLRFAFVMWCAQAPGLQAYLFRRTFPDLHNNHMEGPTGFPSMLVTLVDKGFCQIVRNEVRWWNGARIVLAHLQLEKHVAKYQGAEIHVLGLDEETQFTEAQIRTLRTSVRLGAWKPPKQLEGVFPKTLGGANPGGPSHSYLKQGFIDNGAYVIVRAPKDDGGQLRQFIPARAEDNPDLLRNDPDYLDRLEGMGDPVLVRAYREGDWTTVYGSMFGYAWRANIHGEPWHVCDPFPIPSHWELWRGADDGFNSPHACYWITQDAVSRTFYVLDELYVTGMMAEELAAKIKERDHLIKLLDQKNNQEVYNPRNLNGLLDSAAFSNTGQAIITRGDQMNIHGCKWKPVEKFPGSRAARVKNFHQCLAPNSKYPDRPGIVFFRNCAKAIETIPKLMRSLRDIDDIDDTGEDHAFDGVTYGLQYKKLISRVLQAGGM